MKKLFLSFAVIAGLSMISCGNKAENTEVAADAVDTVEVVEAAVVEEVPADSAAVDTDTVVAVVEEAAAATAE